MKRKTQIIVCALTAFINIAADRITKWIATAFLMGKPPIRLLGGTVVFVYTENTGAFLSLGRDWPEVLKHIVLLYLPVAVCAAVLVYCLVKPVEKSRLIALITIVAGGLGNLVDRIVNDFSVVDFMSFGIGSVRTGVLNVADLSITFGAVAFLIIELKQNRSSAKIGSSGQADSTIENNCDEKPETKPDVENARSNPQDSERE